MRKRLKRTIFIALAFLMALLPGAALAEDAVYADILELYAHWEETGMPDWVSAVSSTDGSADKLTVVLVDGQEDREAELRALLRDDSTLTVVTGGAYSHAALLRVQQEICDRYMGEAGVVAGCGVGWTTVDGKVTGFGESGRESRVVVEVLREHYDEYRKRLEEQYGDMVWVVASDGYVVAEAAMDDSTTVGIIGSADGPTSIFISSDGSPVWVLMLGAGVVLVALAVIVFCCVWRTHKRNF